MLAAGVGSTLTGYVRALAFVRMVWIDQCLCPYVYMNDRPTDRPKNQQSPNSFAAGAGGGVCQVVVMGPCTFLVTAAVTGGDKNVSVAAKAAEVWSTKGIKVGWWLC